MDLITDKKRLHDCVGLQAQVFQLLADYKSAESWSLKDRTIIPQSNYAEKGCVPNSLGMDICTRLHLLKLLNMLSTSAVM